MAAAMQIEDRLYTTIEVARLLGVSRWTVARAVRERKLTQRRLPSAAGVRHLPRYTKAAILAFIESGYAVGLR